MYSIFVTFNIKPEHIGAFKEACLENARAAIREEPGCFCFNMHQDAEIPTRFYLHEVYRDEAAFQAHLETPHLNKWRDTVRAGDSFFDDEPQKNIMKTVFPSEQAWEKHKPEMQNW